MRALLTLVVTATLTSCNVEKGPVAAAMKVDMDASSTEATAIAQFRSNNYKGAAAVWEQAETTLPPQGTELELDTAAFLQRARFRASAGWSLVSAGDVSGGTTRLASAFDELQSAENRFSQARNVQAARGAANFKLASGILEQGLGQAKPLISIGQVFSGMFTNYPTPTINVNLVEEGLRQTDGVRFAVLPTVGIPMLVGQLTNSTTACTVSLVGYELALTNAHCVVDEAGNPSPVTDMHVRFPSLLYADVVGVRRAATFRPDGSWIAIPKANKYSPEIALNDWALLYLDRHPVGRGWFGVSTKLPSGKDANRGLSIMGFSGDLNEGRYMQVTWGCSGARDTRLDVLEHRCATWHGNSGSPIFETSTNENAPVLIALHSFGYNKSGDGGGGPIAARFFDAIANARGEIRQFGAVHDALSVPPSNN